MAAKVIILGGGVAGMSAAHELIERGFEVHVFEKQPAIPGGKARSVPVPKSATEGRHPLPGEHGFRFFPGFYRHVIDTMKRIPDREGKGHVSDHLVQVSQVMMAPTGRTPLVMLTRFPRSLRELEQQIHSLFDADLGFEPGEKEYFAARIWQLMTSCRERRLQEYEHLAWWSFVGAGSRSPAYQTYLARGLTRTLVAAKAEDASTKTGGDIFIQLLFNMADPSIQADRILDGPTNDVWIGPWLAYLQERGVQYHFNSVVTRFECVDNRIGGAFVSEQGSPERRVEGDYYVAAVPVEVIAPLLDDELLALDPGLASLKTLAGDVAWMNGLQIYLNERVDINRGHVIYPDSPWALTSISQPQFWPDFDLADYGPGTVRDILSIDISDWDTPGYNGKTARACGSKKEVMDEVWEQLKRSLNTGGATRLRDEQVVEWHLDGDISMAKLFPVERTPPPLSAPGAPEAKNAEPLLVNKVDTWALRPRARTKVSNLVLASDYVQTYTDLATMEGANEAARRAVNAILEATGSRKEPCAIWPLHEPLALAVFRWDDASRFRRGLPWKDDFSFVVRIAHAVMTFVAAALARVKNP